MRTATVIGHWATRDEAERVVAAYLPGNYEVVSAMRRTEGSPIEVLIEGEDKAGWTLDGYVIPRLASGLYWCEETTTGNTECADCSEPGTWNEASQLYLCASHLEAHEEANWQAYQERTYGVE